ncbi:rhomboid family intramembrane serine protease [bacterium]|nr:rhomboid family intramembrane serine protease [bacterium]
MLQELLLWVAGVGSAITLVRTFHRCESELRFLRAASFLSLVSLFVSTFFFSDREQPFFFVFFLPWLWLLLFPQIVLQRILAAYDGRDWERVIRLSRIVQGGIPLLRGRFAWGRGWERLAQAEQLLLSNERERAVSLLRELAALPSLFGYYAAMRALFALEQWRELEALTFQFLRSGKGRPTFFVVELNLRALLLLGKDEEAQKRLDSLREFFTEESAQYRILQERLAGGVEGALREDFPLSETAAGKFRLPFPFPVLFLGALLLLAFFAGRVMGSDRFIAYFAFDPFQILLFGEYWRLLTCGFVHTEVAHLATNLLGVLILGPFFAKRLGFFGFLLFFVASVVGSSLFLLGLMWCSLLEPQLLIGASGGVMGFIGGYLSDYLQLYRKSGSPYQKSRLHGILLIIFLQSIFDIVTPRVSLVAHLSGALVGFCLSWFFFSRRRSEAGHLD